ncbi:MAG: protein-tyrosine-phosphatase [Bacteroidetes bacterium]|nr:protein-tyrosine-phosphatase [Bacteroidota bacterium]
MYNSIKTYCDDLESSFEEISSDRKSLLSKIATYILEKRSENKTINLIYVCTHNSRRSHFGQVWAQVAADYYQIENVSTFSGGTEATAFNPNAINALKRVGFKIETTDSSLNPHYEVYFSEKTKPIECFSKVYNDSVNPQNNFAAIMTCSDAEENCPFIPGVELRIGTTYDDPKAFDNTPLQDAKYDERCRQIALETLFVFSLVRNGKV